MATGKARYSKESGEEEPTGRPSRSAKRSIAPRHDSVRPVDVGDLLHEIESLRRRLSELSDASRLVSESLELDVVLRNVIDNARSLTGARYGALLTYEQSGAMQDFITSGFSSAEIERLGALPQGLGLLGYMNEIREPLRLSNISDHPRSVGFPENHPPMKTFLGMPIRIRDEYVGTIFLTEKEGGAEFTSEDQDTLVMFASQAGAAISNARRYQEEQRASTTLRRATHRERMQPPYGGVATPYASKPQQAAVPSSRNPQEWDPPVLMVVRISSSGGLFRPFQ